MVSPIQTVHIVHPQGISRHIRHHVPCETLLPGSHSSDLTLWIRDLQRQGDFSNFGGKTVLRNPQCPCCNLSVFQFFLEAGTALKPKRCNAHFFRPAFRRDGAEPADQPKQAGMEGTRRWAGFHDILLGLAHSIISDHQIVIIPVVPHKAVAEVSKIGNL